MKNSVLSHLYIPQMIYARRIKARAAIAACRDSEKICIRTTAEKTIPPTDIGGNAKKTDNTKAMRGDESTSEKPR